MARWWRKGQGLTAVATPQVPARSSVEEILRDFTTTGQSAAPDTPPAAWTMPVWNIACLESKPVLPPVQEGATVMVSPKDPREGICGPTVCGILNVNMIPYMHPHTAETEYRGIRSRICAENNIDTDKAWDDLKTFVSLHHEAIFPQWDVMMEITCEAPEARVIPFERWLLTYPERNRLEKRRAREAFQAFPQLTQKDLQRKAFIKTELLPLSGPAFFEHKSARIIQAASDTFTTQTGPYVQAQYYTTKMVWDLNHFVTMGSGLDSIQLGSWMTNCLTHGLNVFIENDFSKFDSTEGPHCLDFEYWLHDLLNGQSNYTRLMRNQATTTGYGALGTKYTVPGTRHSGDTNTTLDNTRNAALVMLYAICVATGKDVAQIAPSVRILQGGDDNVIAMSPEILNEMSLPEVEEIVKSFGFRPKLRVRTNPYDVTFFSARFWPARVNDAPGHILIPFLGKTLAFHSCSRHHLDTAEKRNAWLKEVIRSHALTSRMFPFMDALFKTELALVPTTPHSREIAGIVRNERRHIFHMDVQGNVEPTAKTTEMFNHLYPDLTFSGYEKLLRTIRQLPAAMSHPDLTFIIMRDMEFDYNHMDGLQDTEPVATIERPVVSTAALLAARITAKNAGRGQLFLPDEPELTVNEEAILLAGLSLKSEQL